MLKKFRLQNKFMSLEFLNYGGIVTAINVPDKKGKYTNVTLGFDDINEYVKANPAYYGAIIGRFANRIGHASFDLDGNHYPLFQNDGQNSLHGGKKGFDKVHWQVDQKSETSAVLSYISADGEEGYPGTLSCEVTYSLNENDWEISYRAVTDKPTIVNLTHHAYFNLSGDFNTEILDHELAIHANAYTESDENWIPTGRVLPVDSVVDFRTPKKIGKDIAALSIGYNHNYLVSGNAARLVDPKSGRTMEVLSTQPGLQLYTGYYLPKKFQAVALETQHFPDSPHHSAFPTTTLRPGEEYRHKTTYRFGK